jgi:hypothetical protein
MVVVALNAVVLTIFLWHLSAAVLLAGGLGAAHLLPTPQVDTAGWWLWRIPWLVMLTVVLAVLVAIFGPIERRGTHRPPTRPRRIPAWLADAVSRPVPRALLTVGGFAGVVVGLLTNNLAPKTGEEPLGVPTGSLVAFLAGVGILRLLRSLP